MTTLATATEGRGRDISDDPHPTHGDNPEFGSGRLGLDETRQTQNLVTPGAFGVHDLVGNGWEWTATIFGGFEGFTPTAAYPEYSADFFDNAHFVLKGASQATARELLRPSFRNWFRPNYPYVYATFRCVSAG